MNQINTKGILLGIVLLLIAIMSTVVVFTTKAQRADIEESGTTQTTP